MRLIDLWKDNPLVEGGYLCPIMPFRVWFIAAVLTMLGVILLVILFISLYLA